MALGKFKDFPRRTDFDKLLCDQAFNIAKNPKYDISNRFCCCGLESFG